MTTKPQTVKMYFLNICRKQKGKAEKQELQKAINRAKREGLL